jgi:hypothetical protein
LPGKYLNTGFSFTTLMLETLIPVAAGVAIGTCINPFYEHFIKPYAMFRHSGMNFFSANKQHISDLGHAVSEWHDSYKMKNFGMHKQTKHRDKLPQEVKDTLAENLNYQAMRQIADDMAEKYKTIETAGYNWLDMCCERLARKTMIKSFYREPAVAAYLASK